MKTVVGIDGDICECENPAQCWEPCGDLGNDEDHVAWINALGYLENRHGLLHRQVAERALDRPLLSTEIVHHVDNDKLNNEPTNLVICQDQAYHMLLHARQKIVDMGGSPSTHKYCAYHEELHLKTEFSTSTSYCRKGLNEYRKLTGKSQSKFGWRDRLGQQYRRYTKETISWL